LHLALLQVVLAAEVTSTPADRAEARAQGAALVRQLEAEGLRVVPGPPRPQPTNDEPGGDPELSAQIVDGAIGEARRQSEQFEEAKALATLDRAETAYRRAPQIDVKPMLDLLLLRARIQFDVGKTAAARETLRRVAALDPTHKLDPGEFEPRLLSLWQTERKATAKTQGAITVEGEGQVMIDGSPRGNAPQTLVLPAGEHFVALGAPGRTPVVETVILRNGDTRTVRPPPPREGRRDPPPAPDVREAARTSGAKAIVESRLRRERDRMVLESRLVDTASGRVLATASGPPEQIAGAFATALRPVANTHVPDDHKADDDGPGSPFYTRWWFWTAIGVVIVGGAVAAFALSSSDNVGVVLHR
jgi:PEGA domain-containing protein